MARAGHALELAARNAQGSPSTASSSHLINMASTSGTSTSDKVQAKTVLYCDGKPLLELLLEGIVILIAFSSPAVCSFPPEYCEFSSKSSK